MAETTKGKRIGIVLLIAAAALVVTGVCFGGYADSFANAVRICLECIGIG